ncbi:MAG: hypothetical protein JOY62_10685 [Acidobacteriaceae bacterium]|nr:hypothetical protein [Acidobacteriaceae bacterium]MBV9780425.1 hypothetical protein [Acidobacteriaceae bacterium]
MLSQQKISPSTPLGATLNSRGASFRVWAPRATAVYLLGTFNGTTFDQPTGDRLLERDKLRIPGTITDFSRPIFHSW